MLCACTGDSINKQAPTNDVFATPDYEGHGPWFTCDPAGEMKPRLAANGVASEATEPTTLPLLLKRAATAKGASPAMKVERPCPELVDGKAPPALPIEDWETWTYQRYLDDARRAAKGFVHLGLARFDSVNVWGFNSPEWLISAYGASFGGAKVAGIYPTDNAETAAYKVVHSGGAIVVLEDRSKLQKLVQGLKDRGDCKRLKAIVAYGFEPAAGETADVAGVGAVPVLGWSAALALGDKVDDSEIEQRIECTSPGHCAALIYTSGTTGMPKAVMISHDNIVYISSACFEVLRRSAGVSATAAQERMLSYLPLSHVAGFLLDIVSPVFCAATTDAYTTTCFARAYDLKAGSLKDRLCAVKPTIFLGVPLVWEKIADKMRAIGAETTGVKKVIATWAKSQGLAYAKECQLGGTGAKPFGYGLAETVVLSKIKANLGLECLKYGMTGAAPIRTDTLEYFAQLGIEINEVYGMSESCGLATISTHQAHVWGSCGFECPGVELKAFIVDPADLNKRQACPGAEDMSNAKDEEQGELCWRSRGNMMGYMANPDLGEEHVKEIQQKTAEAIDADGWLHSGDKGLVTREGMVKITGRYKELIIGEGGENIAPVPIEDHVKKTCDGIAEIMMVGDKRKYNVALVTLKAVGANGEVPGTDALDAGAKRVNKDVQTISGAMDDKVWIDAITAAITSVNSSKICTNQAFKIQKFMILPTNFSEAGNELTPTKKLKRAVVAQKYSAAIERLYAEKASPYVRYQE